MDNENEQNIDLANLSETDKVYLKGGLRYDMAWGKRFIVDHTSLGNGSGTLLDLACGDGFWSFILSEWYDVTGEDLSRGGIHVGRKRANEEKVPVSFKLTDSLSETGEFDIVFARGPSFWSNRSPEDSEFELGLEKVIPRACKKLVYITYTQFPYSRFNETGSSYYHDPDVLRECFGRYGDVSIDLVDNYVVCELVR